MSNKLRNQQTVSCANQCLMSGYVFLMSIHLSSYSVIYSCMKQSFFLCKLFKTSNVLMFMNSNLLSNILSYSLLFLLDDMPILLHCTCLTYQSSFTAHILYLILCSQEVGKILSMLPKTQSFESLSTCLPTYSLTLLIHTPSNRISFYSP